MTLTFSVLLLTNAALAGLAFTWTFIGMSYYIRHRELSSLFGAIFAGLLFFIFILRTINVSGAQVPWSNELLIRILWLSALLDGLAFSFAYIKEKQLLRKPESRKGTRLPS